MAVFLCGWTFSYFSLPEGILRGRLSGHLLGSNGLTGGSVWLEWLRLFAINASVMLLLMIAPNVLLTEGGFPFGYGTVTLQSVLCSAVLGTDSFAIPLGRKMPPTVSFIWSPGFLEISAYVLAAAATISISRYRLVGKWPKQTIEKLVPSRAKFVISECRMGLFLATAILLTSCGWEAYRISLAVAP